ncbi:uncharacterized protein LOC118647037 isoform X1 [Monomorium pharaonis]|uniref:uncharacterized protein LOC118644259 isoform X1 n=1 Tax=Monomorium pharaonis TaxID=307658 RepID=UPI001746A616|nr:uncharacterized protein LOC118644259 isoform X1 [Monomorium pharaonis]XP_036138733.1 uncharacterized protein LOC118644381 isoform X1 [Monomorium pharaonis]XP_036141602.1 uncharacterized protein LOC118645159 isoform X1 [Monomorium pharaonis]XP_036142929.1 uncharacterized protein LOC118645612 isoform X1 [Monomorium pharaonis]XP_036147054.1 uncharacterized protein LOC118647037 isoform X1 [Monomorium pharaonis]
MAFLGIEFMNGDNKEEPGEIAVIHQAWLTPLKKEIWWPPYKTSAQFRKALSIGEEPKETWTIYELKRTFFTCDDLDKALTKIKKFEEVSDIQSSASDNNDNVKKRNRKPNLKYVVSSSSEEEVNENESSFRRPPKISRFVHEQQDESCHQDLTSESMILSPLAKTAFSSQAIRSDNSSTSTHSWTENVDALNSPKQTPCTTVSTNTIPQSNSSNSTLINQDCISCRAHLCFSEKIFAKVKKVREEIKELKGILRQQNTEGSIPSIPDDLAVEFPLKTREELQVLEDYLNSRQNKNAMSLYFTTLGGDSISTKTNRILKLVLSNELAATFNFTGTNVKEAFQKLHLKNVIVHGVQKTLPLSTEKDVESAIKIWLKHAPDRIKEALKKNRR